MTLKVLFPNSREVIETGSAVPIKWTSTTTGTVRIAVYSGSRWARSLADVPAAQGAFSWTVPQDFPIGSLYRVRVELLPTAAVRDYSDGYFTIKREAPPAPPPSSSVVTTPPQGLGIDYGYYRKYLNSTCGHIVSSVNVSDEALLEVRSLVDYWLSGRLDLQNKLRSLGHRFIVIGQSEGQTTPPEYRNLDRDFPIEGGWDARARGLGAQPGKHYTSCAEENVLNLGSSDRYRGESILLHEFGHTIHRIAANYVIPGFDARLRTAFTAAVAAGLWKDTYADNDYLEYWAEGCQTWFSANKYVSAPDGVHNTINTRAELYGYDRTLYNLLDETFAV